MKNLVFIENLKCGGCENSIRKALAALPGVENVDIDFGKNSVAVETSSGGTARPAIVKILDALGYPETGGHNSLLKKGKSLVSCAIGRVSG